MESQPAFSQPRVKFNLKSIEWYLNRELMRLAFNRRVLHEGQNERVPLLERVFLLAVIGSNLDEFFMKRIGGLKQQIGAQVRELSLDGLLPEEQIDVCTSMVRGILSEQEKLENKLKRLLAEKNIRIIPYADLSLSEKTLAEQYFLEQIYPLLTPQGMDPAHPFPFISNLSINLLVTGRYPDTDRSYMNRIKVPISKEIKRFISIGENGHIITLEDLISNNLEVLFPGLFIETCETFRVTRNAITEPALEQANDLLQMIESALRERKFAEIVRLEVGWGMLSSHRQILASQLGVHEGKDVFEVNGILAKCDFRQIAKIDWPELHYPAHKPVDHPELLGDDPNIFHVIRTRGPILLQHPYESFNTSVERFLREASTDPKVRAIKMTLYRTSGKSRIIEYLIDAAVNGKQVAVVLELKARFDEQANIRWAGHLEEAGIHVTYGVLGLKTHCKVIFVVRKDHDGLRRYAHIGTGNYHSGTARQYCDLGLLTCDPDIGSDLTELFNYLTTGYTPMRRYRKLLVSPKMLKKSLLKKISREIKFHSVENPGCIQMKANALEDRDIIAALYRASVAGVRVELIIRDSCMLRPGIPQLSENIRVVSLVGRFLEHARILYFKNQGNGEYFIGSADLMQRNLENRVELCVPIESEKLKNQIREILDLQLSNSRNSWNMLPDGRYIPLDESNGDECIHQRLIQMAEKRSAGKYIPCFIEKE